MTTAGGGQAVIREAEMIRQGLAHQRSGRLLEAEALYREVLLSNPAHPDANHFLGLIAHQRGLPEAAAELISKAIATSPGNPALHNNLGIVLKAEGRLDEAEAEFRKALSLEPRYGDASHNLGTVLKARGRLAEAAVCFRKAIAAEPDSPTSYVALGNTLQRMEHAEDAALAFRKALGIEPHYAEAHNGLGMALHALGNDTEAIASFRNAVAHNPRYAEAHYNLGTALQEVGRTKEAIEEFRESISLDPAYVEAHNNLGTALQDLGRTDAAINTFRKALSLREDYIPANYNLGTGLQETGELAAAEACFRRVLDLSPTHVDAAFNLSFILLSAGRFAEAWQFYELRLSDTKSLDPTGRVVSKAGAPFVEALADFDGARLMVFGEQGLGDEIMFASIVPEVAMRTECTVLAVDGRLVNLFRRSFPEAVVISRTDGEFRLPRPIDLTHAINVGSLPKFFRLAAADFPGTPYLMADPAKRAEMRARLAAIGEKGPRIGIMWRGGVGGRREHLRSLTLDELRPILLPGAAWVSLSHLAAADEEVAAFGERTGVTIHHWPDVLRSDNYDDTAALLAELDCVVSVTGTVAHCAAALGVDTHVLVNRRPEWRYAGDGMGIPWYAAMKLYRQHDRWPLDEIAAVVAEIAAGSA